MEITTSPHRPASTPWGRLLALVVIVAPVSILVLLPIGLGLDRYVMSGGSMDSGAEGGISQGSVVFERAVPVGDLRIGDVITFRPPADAQVDGLVTHRIVGIGPEGIRTRGDAESARDPWMLQPQEPTLPRVVYTLPWVGYGYLVIFHPVSRLLMVGSAVLLVLLIASEIRRRRGGAVAPGEELEEPGPPAQAVAVGEPEGSER
jgi:signal peptidase I